MVYMLFSRNKQKLTGMCSPVWRLNPEMDYTCHKSTIIKGVGDPENAGTYNVSQFMNKLEKGVGDPENAGTYNTSLMAIGVGGPERVKLKNEK